MELRIFLYLRQPDNTYNTQKQFIHMNFIYIVQATNLSISAQLAGIASIDTHLVTYSKAKNNKQKEKRLNYNTIWLQKNFNKRIQ